MLKSTIGNWIWSKYITCTYGNITGKPLCTSNICLLKRKWTSRSQVYLRECKHTSTESSVCRCLLQTFFHNSQRLETTSVLQLWVMGGLRSFVQWFHFTDSTTQQINDRNKTVWFNGKRIMEDSKGNICHLYVSLEKAKP
jgi:hypothetical protein